MTEVDYVIADWQTRDLAHAARASLDKAGVEYTVQIIDAFSAGWSYSEAIRHGVEIGSAPIICALNADVECRGDQRAVLDLFENPEVAVVGPLQTDTKGLIRHGGIFGRNELPWHRGWGEPLALAVQTEPSLLGTEDAITVSGSVYYARRSTWEELGGFLATPFYYEETWFSYLARHRGYRVLYTGECEWLHHWASSPATDVEKQGWFMASQALFRQACAAEGIACD